MGSFTLKRLHKLLKREEKIAESDGLKQGVILAQVNHKEYEINDAFAPKL